MEFEVLAGRLVPQTYAVSGKGDLHEFLLAAVAESGARLLYVSSPRRAPIYLGIQLDSEERIGVLVYPFRVTMKAIKNRPTDEVRGQLRYGSEGTWQEAHAVARDVAGVDATLILGIDLEHEVMIGLDTQLWDPLPMGVSFYAKFDEICVAQRTGWHVWEKVNRPGTKRRSARSPSNLETVVAFKKNRLIDYVRLERRASSLGLDPALRYSVATRMSEMPSDGPATRHVLEKQFELSSEQILDIIGGRNRLAVAVRGGVAEHHLERYLSDHPDVVALERLDADAQHDFNVWFSDEEMIRVECKNASPNRYASGDFKVEVQKTRASKDDPASRFYKSTAFDVVAACVYSSTGKWEFRFGRTDEMHPHTDFPDRLAPIQAVGASWSADISALRRNEDGSAEAASEHCLRPRPVLKRSPG